MSAVSAMLRPIQMRPRRNNVRRSIVAIIVASSLIPVGGASAQAAEPPGETANRPPIIRETTKRSLFNQYVAFTPTVIDESAGVRVELLVDGKLTDSDPSAPYYLGWDVAGQRDGNHMLTLRATDQAGLRSEISRPVVVDRTAPTVTGLSPAHKAFVRGTFTVRANVRDAYGVAAVRLDVDGKRTGVDTRPPYSITVRTKQASWFLFYAFDKAGNLATVERHIFVDTERPTISKIKAPGHRARVRGRVSVTLRAEDDYGPVPRVALVVNGRVVARASKFPYRLTVDTRRQKRTMRVQFRAYDKAGNVKTTKTRIWYRR